MSRLIDADLIQYEPMLSAKGNGQYDEVLVAYKSQIDDLPTIERKTGKWMRTYDGHYLCDHCGEQCADEIMGKPRDRYCKWCGADMRGDRNETD